MFIYKHKAVTAAMAVLLTAVLALAGCSSGGGSTTATESATASVTTVAYFAVSPDYDDADMDASWDEDNATAITLGDNSIAVAGEGVSAAGSTVTISAAGTYVVSGELTNGQINVDAGDEDIVQIGLRLNTVQPRRGHGGGPDGRG